MDGGFPDLSAAVLASDPINELVAEFNDRYMVVSEGGKVMLYQPDTDPILNRRFYQRLDFADFQKMWMNRTVRNGVDKKGDPVFSQVAPLWLRHPDRRQFIGGVIFDPSGSSRDPEKLNLWQGFAIPPKRGTWNRMKDHILKVVCAGDDKINEYVMNWCARMVQFPAQRGEVAIVMKGVEGTGKGTLANALRKDNGPTRAENIKRKTPGWKLQLASTGLRISIRRRSIFCRRQGPHRKSCKSLITEDSLTIEAKYTNPGRNSELSPRHDGKATRNG